jgi:hypothetical protein
MTQILVEIASIAGQSIAEHKVRHVIAAGGGSAGMIEANKEKIISESTQISEVISLIPDWLPLGDMLTIASFALVGITFYKTWIEASSIRETRKNQRLQNAILDRREK